MSEMKKRWDSVPNWAKYTLYTILGLGGAVLLGLLFGNVVMWLWNWLMPKLFGLGTIGFWEALGLFALARILLGFGGSGHSDDSGSKQRKKKKPRNSGGEVGEDGKGWEYYDDWWDEDGKAAFRAYAERMKKDAGQQSTPKSGEA